MKRVKMKVKIDKKRVKVSLVRGVRESERERDQLVKLREVVGSELKWIGRKGLLADKMRDSEM